LPDPAAQKTFSPSSTVRASRLAALFCCVIALYYSTCAAKIAGFGADVFNAIGNLFGNTFGVLLSLLGGVFSTFLLLLLLLVGFGLMGRWINKQRRPLVCMGLQFRPGWMREWAIGAALGWGIIIVAVLPMAVAGSLHFAFALTPSTLWLCAINVAVLLLVALTKEIIYRGYPFQQLLEAIGPTAATLLMAAWLALETWNAPSLIAGQQLTATLVTILSVILFSVAYLRTRALWLAWGLHFAWTFSEGILFGLPLSGYSRFATIIQTDTTGPLWLTGGDFGPEATLSLLLALGIAIVVLFAVTRDLNWKYNAPILIPGGIPMDVPPPDEHTAMEKVAAATPAPLVQIAAITPATTSPPEKPS
jgi:membrane protease YdiL (CAAX protease family)